MDLSNTHLKKIDNQAFYYCWVLEEVILPEGVISIGDEAFEQCNYLTTVNLPNSIQHIGESAFNCSDLVTVNIPTNLTRLEDNVFNNIHFSSVVIPASVTSIGAYALSGVWLETVYCLGNAPACDSTAFDSSDWHCTVYYTPGATGWGPTLGGAKTALWSPVPFAMQSHFDTTEGLFQFDIVGNGNTHVVIEACTNLTTGLWFPVSTNRMSNNRTTFSEPQSTEAPGRYYRVRNQ